MFIETGQSSRDKFMSSGQQVAVSGEVIGYYRFRRNGANKKALPDPWDAAAEEAVGLAEQVEDS